MLRKEYTKIKERGNFFFHVLALSIVSVWAVTFISTKILLASGLTPSDIMFYRFLLAYLGLCICSRPFIPFAKSFKDEMVFVLLGLFGGTLYFITENTALDFTMVSNVALICSTSPLITVLLKSAIDRSRPSRGVIVGSFIALMGVFAVIFNSNFIIRINPLGDLLCLCSALSWSLYTIFTKYLGGRYSALFITRKTFFYGIITLLPIIMNEGLTISTDVLFSPEVVSRLLFLGIVASFLCFMLWNVCLEKINTVILSNYIYLMPVISILASALVLGEDLNLVIMAGALFVLLGMYIAGKVGSGKK